VLWWC